MATVKKTTEAPKAEDKAVEKVYKFTSIYRALTVSSLGVQFVDGVATTTDLAVARALVTIDGVELVEE